MKQRGSQSGLDDYLEKEEVGPKMAATPGLMSSHSSLLALKLSS